MAVVLAGCASPDDDGAWEDKQAEVAFDFGEERDGDRIEEVVRYDPRSRPTMQLYEQAEAERPDAYTVHDLLVDAQEQTDADVETIYEANLGYRLVAVNGVEPGPGEFWALYVDGERETAGIGTVVVEEDSTYEWRIEEVQTSGEESGEAHVGDGGGTDAGGDAGTDDDGDRSTGDSSPSGGDSPPTREATMVVDYNGFRNEEPQRTEHEAAYNPNDRPTMHRYEEADVSRPDDYVLHDLVSDWSNQTDTDYIVREDDEMGFVLQSIDGVTAHSTGGGSWTWELSIDGEEETAGLGTIRVEDDRTYEWTFTYHSRR